MLFDLSFEVASLQVTSMAQTGKESCHYPEGIKKETNVKSNMEKNKIKFMPKKV